MRFLLPLLVTAAAVTAQSPLTTTFANNNGGNVGGAVYFELKDISGAGVTITSLDLNFGAALGTAVGADIYMAAPGTAHTAPGWSLVANATGTAAGSGQPTPLTLSNNLGIGPNSTWKFALVGVGTAHAYTTATGLPNPLAANADLELDAGTASNAPFVGTLFNPRLVNTNIYYTLGGVDPSIAKAEVEGPGCVSEFASYYEMQTPAAMDLANSQLEATNTGAGYIVIHNPTATINPVGSVDPAAVPLVLGDDVSTPAGTLGLQVYSNGQVSFGGGNSTNWVPAVAVLLSNPQRAIYSWTDLSPNLAGSGQVTYEENAATGDVQVTYDGVYAFGTTAPSTVQYRLNVNSGDYVLAFGTLHTTGPENWLVGYSLAGANADPGPSDLNSGVPVQTFAADTLPLALAADNRPVQGAAPAPVTMTVSNIPATGVFHLAAVGLNNPALPLSLIGFPGGCVQNADAAILLGPDVIIGQSSFQFTALTLPAGPNPALNGFVFRTQSFVLDLTVLSASARASNGVKCTVGDL